MNQITLPPGNYQFTATLEPQFERGDAVISVDNSKHNGVYIIKEVSGDSFFLVKAPPKHLSRKSMNLKSFIRSYIK